MLVSASWVAQTNIPGIIGRARLQLSDGAMAWMEKATGLDGGEEGSGPTFSLGSPRHL